MMARIRREPMLGWAIGLILAGLGGLLTVVPFAVWTHLGQRADERSRWSAVIADDFGHALWQSLETVSVPLVAAGATLAAVIALLRRRGDLAVAVVLLIGGANVTTQLGKALLPRRNFGIGVENTLPSGHMTVITSLILALVIVVPRLLRLPMVVIASFLAALAGAAIVILRWHRPSDVVAAVGVLAVWAGAGLLAAYLIRRPGRARPGTMRTEGPTASADLPLVRQESGGPQSGAGASVATAVATAAPAGASAGFGTYLLVALSATAMSGVTLVLGGLAAHEEPSNALVAGLTFSIAGVAAAVLVAMAAAGSDASDHHAGS